MKTMNNSLFLRLWLSIAAVIIASILLVSLALDYYHNDTGEVDFVADISFIAQQLAEQDSQRWVMKAQMLSELTGFDIKQLSPQQKQQFIADHEWLETRDGFDVYVIDEYSLAGLNGLLMVSDGPDKTDPQELAESFESLFLLAFIFIAIAVVLYLSVQRIASQVRQLSDASQALASGKLDTRVNEAMPAPLQQMAASFNHMAESLQYARQQQVMANAIAHELRTPLTRIQLALGILNEQQHDEMTKGLHQDIIRYAVEMEELANDILTLQRVDHASEIQTKAVDVDGLVKQRHTEFQRLFPQLTVTADLQDTTINANQRYLQLIIDNLVSNACKYANAKVHIKLERSGSNCVLTVEDDGEGISPPQRQQILEPFARLDNSRSRQTGGFGLGLAIVNTIIKKMDSKLIIDISDSGGAKFVVELSR
jgi:two-component system sensor histidine kinase RstB